MTKLRDKVEKLERDLEWTNKRLDEMLELLRLRRTEAENLNNRLDEVWTLIGELAEVLDMEVFHVEAEPAHVKLGKKLG